jgi:hypothetical protein
MPGGIGVSSKSGSRVPWKIGCQPTSTEEAHGLTPRTCSTARRFGLANDSGSRRRRLGVPCFAEAQRSLYLPCRFIERTVIGRDSGLVRRPPGLEFGNLSINRHGHPCQSIYILTSAPHQHKHWSKRHFVLDEDTAKVIFWSYVREEPDGRFQPATASRPADSPHGETATATEAGYVERPRRSR